MRKVLEDITPRGDTPGKSYPYKKALKASVTDNKVSWKDRVAFVVGVTTPIGKKVFKALAQQQMIVYGCAENIPLTLQEELDTTNHLIECEIWRYEQVRTLMRAWNPDVIINCEETNKADPLLYSNSDEMKQILKLNVKGALVFAREGTNMMLQREDLKFGHIFFLNSMKGHFVDGEMNLYSTTKFAVTSIVHGLRKELAEKGANHIRVTAISPSPLDMDANNSLRYLFDSVLEPTSVANAVIYALNAPKYVTVNDVHLSPIDLKDTIPVAAPSSSHSSNSP